MSIRLIASDLDGTLLTDKKEIAPYTKEALLFAVREKGCCFIPATGRAFTSIPPEVTGFPGVEYVITSNGAAVYSAKSGERIYQCLLSREAVEMILSIPLWEDAAMEVFVEGNPYASAAYIEDPGAYGATSFGCAYVKRTRTSVSDIRAFARENKERIDSISFATANGETKKEIKERLQKEGKDIYVTSSVSHMLEIGNSSAGKGNTLAVMLERLGIAPGEAMAFGDGDNDKEMLACVKYGIAMANASEDCKKAAYFVTASNEEDGVGKAIRRFLG